MFRKNEAYLRYAQQTELAKLETRIDEIERTEDSGEKLLKLENLKAAIQGQIEDIRANAKSHGKGKFNAMYLGGAGAQMGILTGIAIATTMPAIILLCVPMAIVMKSGSQKYALAAKKRFLEEKCNYILALEAHMASVSEQADKILTGPLELIARSTKIEKILETCPDLKNRFAAAAVKKILDTPIPANDKPEFKL